MWWDGRMRAPLASLLMLLLSLPFSAAWGAPVSDQRDVLPDGELRLRMEAGRLVVRAGQEPKVLVEADLAPAQALRWRGNERGLALIIDDSTRLRPRDAEVRLTVPAGLRLVLSVGDAAVDAEGVGAAGLAVSGGNGDIRLASVAGSVAADSRAGRIEADLGNAGARVSTLSGAVVLRAAQGPSRLSVQTLSGTVDLSLAAPVAVKVETVSGAITARFDVLQSAEVQLESLRGDLTLDLAAGSAANLKLAAATGSIALPPDAVQQPEGSVRLGEGAGRVRMGSFAGGLTVLTTRVPAPTEAVTPITPPGARPASR
jgi:hypothetical protein